MRTYRGVMQIFGVDIGGTGIKGAPVDLDRGDLADERFKVPTPHHSSPDRVAEQVKDVVQHFRWQGPIGVTFPGVVTDGATIRTAANVDASWIDVDARTLLSERVGAAAARSSSSPSEPASAARCSSTATWCPTPNWAIWNCTATTPRNTPRPRSRKTTT
jgi:hypothetical protein